MSDISEWFKSLPIFTRYWLGLTACFTLLGRFGVLSPYLLILLYEPLINRIQIWRPVTALFYYPLSPSTGFHFLINCYFLYSYSLRLETEQYQSRPADYLFLLVFNWMCCVVIGLIAELPLLMDPMVLSVLYVWCQLNRDMIVNFWFGSRFKAMYLPWVLLGFNMIVSGGGVMELVGILVGHLYFFLKYKYPGEMGGPQLLKTPAILYRWFPSGSNIHGFGSVPTRPAQTVGGGTNVRRHDWGRGQTLGDR